MSGGVATRAAATLRWGRRFLRMSALRRSAAACACAAAFVVLLFISMQGLTLAPDQAIERDLGVFDADAGSGTVAVPAGSHALDSLDGALVEGGVDDPFVSITVSGMTVGNKRADGWEAEWAREPYPDRYHLTQGAWATGPGEVVLVGSVGRQVRVGDELPVFSGLLRLKVVGLASDEYPSETPSLLMGPGTWRAADPQINTAFKAASATPIVLWKDATRQTAFAAMMPVLSAAASADERESLAGALNDSYFDRDSITYDNTQSWVEKNPAGYNVPSVTLPILAVLVAAGLAGPNLRRRSRALVLLGIGRRRAAAALFIPLSVFAVVFTLIGIGAGCVLGVVVRSVLARVHDEPLSPYPSVTSVALRVGVGVAVGLFLLLIGLIVATRSSSPAGTDDDPHPRRGRLLSPSDLRHVVAAFAVAGMVWWLPKVNTPQDAMWLAGFFSAAALLATPELVAIVRRLLPRRRLVSVLAGRMIDDNRLSFVVAVALLGSLLGISAGYLVLVTTLVRTANDAAAPEVFRGQVLVTDRATPVAPVPRKAASVVEDVVGNRAEGVQLYFSTTPIDRPNVEAAHLADLPGFILYVDSVADLQAITGERVSAPEARLLEDGGVIQWRMREEAAVGQTSRITLEGQPDTTWPVATLSRVAPNVGWRFGKDAVALRDTAEDLGLPLTAGAVLYSGLTDSEVAEVGDRIAASGVDPGTVKTYEAPEQIVPPTALKLTSIGLVVIAIAMTTLEARSRVATLARYATRLTQLGVRRSWTWWIFGLQETMLLLAGTVLALFIGLVPVCVSALTMEGDYVLVIPWAEVTVLVAAIYGGCIIATIWGLVRLRRVAEKAAGTVAP